MTEHKEARPPLYPRFIWALLSGAKIELAEAPPSGKLRSWSQEGLASVTEIAATQLAAQRAQLDRLLGRSQLLFTTLLGLFALLVALAPGIWSSQTPLWEGWIPRSLLLLSAALLPQRGAPPHCATWRGGPHSGSEGLRCDQRDRPLQLGGLRHRTIGPRVCGLCRYGTDDQ
jgi:hypothetical protein